MWSQSTRLVREGALGPLSFTMKDSIQSNQRTFKQNSYWLIGVSYNTITLQFKGTYAEFNTLEGFNIYQQEFPHPLQVVG